MMQQNQAIKIAKEIKQIAQTLYGDELADVVLYGSYARNEAWEESDLDLMVVFKTPHQYHTEIKKIIPLTFPIQLENDIFISFLLTDVEKFSSTPLPIYNNIKREGIFIA